MSTQCPTCNGDGVVESNTYYTRECNRCRGSGRIDPAQERVEAELETLRRRVTELEALVLKGDQNLAALSARHEAIMAAPRNRLGRWLAKSMFHRFVPVLGPDWDKSPPRPDLHECHLWRADSPRKRTTLAVGTGADPDSAMVAALDAIGEP